MPQPTFLDGGSTYPGGKGGCYQHIINLMPPHRRYFETHLGGGAVMRMKRRAEVNVGIDADIRVIERWHGLRHAGVELLHGDAVQALRTLQPRRGDLVYCDPPYLPESRRRRRVYRHDYRRSDHEDLIGLLRTLPCHVVLSGYQSTLHDHLLADWHLTEFIARTRAGPAVEAVWTNFRPGPILHDYAFVGSDFRERERLRRRISSLAVRLARAEPLERNAVLAAVAELQPEAVKAAARRIP